ncbi:MAG: helix-turn-helix domain-containing protein [Verrucomicrobiae bacterium]|nr:helix-turn-helix domain-containing protein [Verrucomicrobiae bacterium]
MTEPESNSRIHNQFQAEDRLLTIREACIYLGISRTTLYRLRRRGELPFQFIGNTKCCRIKASDCDNLLRRLKS